MSMDKGEGMPSNTVMAVLSRKREESLKTKEEHVL